MTTTSIRRMLQQLAVACALLLVAAPGAIAADPYAIDIGAGVGPGWTSARVAGFAVAGNTLSTTGTAVTPGTSASLTYTLPSTDLQLVGGSVDLTQATLPQLRATVETGTGSTTTLEHGHSGSGSEHVVLRGSTARFLRIGLQATAAWSGIQSNSVVVHGASLLVRDSSPPTMSVTNVPSPTAWHGPTGCPRLFIESLDDDSGIVSTRLRDVATDATIASWAATPAAGPTPGEVRRRTDLCIPEAQRPHGTSTYELVARNASGSNAATRFSLRTDRRAPAITDGPVERVDHEAPHAPAPFHVADPDAGLGPVTARVDGAVVAASVDGEGEVRLDVAPLAPGIHVIELTAADAVGNVASTERRINVVDTTPPVLERVTPGDSGGASFELLLRARDAVSGIRASSWQIAVNAVPVTGSGDATSFAATIASLAPGTHRIDAGVSDLAGNRSTLTFTYVVAAPADMPKDIADQVAQLVTTQAAAGVTATIAGSGDPTGAAAAAGGVGTSSGTLGAWIVRGATVDATFGMPAEVTVFVARSGRAVPGRRVSIQRGGVEIATGTTGEDGLARVGYTAGQPGAHGVVVDGLDAMPLQVRVSPRLLVATARTARRGTKVRVTGRLQPALAGQVVVLEARSGGGWFVVRRGIRTGRGGTFATTFQANARGRFQLRVRYVARDSWQAATSATSQLKVR